MSPAAKATPEESPLYKSDNFRLYCYKVLPCSKRYAHDWTSCPFSHPGEKAKRRDPRLFSYTGIACPDMKKAGRCEKGDSCLYSHSVFEYWLHPSRYRTQLCNDGAECKRKICFFAHSIEELRVPTCKPVSPDVPGSASCSFDNTVAAEQQATQQAVDQSRFFALHHDELAMAAAHLAQQRDAASMTALLAADGGGGGSWELPSGSCPSPPGIVTPFMLSPCVSEPSLSYNMTSPAPPSMGGLSGSVGASHQPLDLEQVADAIAALEINHQDPSMLHLLNLLVREVCTARQEQQQQQQPGSVLSPSSCYSPAAAMMQTSSPATGGGGGGGLGSLHSSPNMFRLDGVSGVPPLSVLHNTLQSMNTQEALLQLNAAQPQQVSSTESAQRAMSYEQQQQQQYPRSPVLQPNYSLELLLQQQQQQQRGAAQQAAAAQALFRQQYASQLQRSTSQRAASLDLPRRASYDNDVARRTSLDLSFITSGAAAQTAARQGLSSLGGLYDVDGLQGPARGNSFTSTGSGGCSQLGRIGSGGSVYSSSVSGGTQVHVEQQLSGMSQGKLSLQDSPHPGGWDSAPLFGTRQSPPERSSLELNSLMGGWDVTGRSSSLFSSLQHADSSAAGGATAADVRASETDTCYRLPPVYGARSGSFTTGQPDAS